MYFIYAMPIEILAKCRTCAECTSGLLDFITGGAKVGIDIEGGREV